MLLHRFNKAVSLCLVLIMTATHMLAAGMIDMLTPPSDADAQMIQSRIEDPRSNAYRLSKIAETDAQRREQEIVQQVFRLLKDGKLYEAMLASLRAMQEDHDKGSLSGTNYFIFALYYGKQPHETIKAVLENDTKEPDDIVSRIVGAEIEQAARMFPMSMHQIAMNLAEYAVTEASIDILLKTAEVFIKTGNEDLAMDIIRSLTLSDKPAGIDSVLQFMSFNLQNNSVENLSEISEKLAVLLVQLSFKVTSDDEAVLLREKTKRIASVLIENKQFDASMRIAKALYTTALSHIDHTAVLELPIEFIEICQYIIDTGAEETYARIEQLISEIMLTAPEDALFLAGHLTKRGYLLSDNTRALIGRIRNRYRELAAKMHQIESGVEALELEQSL